MTNVRPTHWAAVLLAAFSAAPAFAVDITPSGDLRAAIAALKPGEELVLAGGSYNLNSRGSASPSSGHPRPSRS